MTISTDIAFRRRGLLTGAAAASALALVPAAGRAQPKLAPPTIIKAGTLVMSINPTLPPLQFVDDKGELSLKPVVVKSYESNDVVISGGVDEGARVVALGVQKLDPAQKVRVVSSLSF